MRLSPQWILITSLLSLMMNSEKGADIEVLCLTFRHHQCCPLHRSLDIMRSSLLFFALWIGLSLYAEPAQASKTGDLLHDWFFPEPGYGIEDEIRCYNLPFGGIGFLSHILTYYTVVMLVLARSPLVPRPGMLLRHSWFDFTLSVLSVGGTVPVAAMNIHACRQRWEFVCIAVWKLTMSFTLSVIGIHQCFCLPRGSEPRTRRANYDPDLESHSPYELR